MRQKDQVASRDIMGFPLIGVAIIKDDT